MLKNRIFLIVFSCVFIIGVLVGTWYVNRSRIISNKFPPDTQNSFVLNKIDPMVVKSPNSKITFIGTGFSRNLEKNEVRINGCEIKKEVNIYCDEFYIIHPSDIKNNGTLLIALIPQKAQYCMRSTMNGSFSKYSCKERVINDALYSITVFNYENNSGTSEKKLQIDFR